MSLLDDTLHEISPRDEAARRSARARLRQLAMPRWSMGRLMDLAEDLAAMTGIPRPSFEEKAIVTMAGDHGVVAEGVSTYPPQVTGQMVHNFAAGGATINVLARLVRARVVVVDMGVASDLSELANAGRIIDKKIALGTQNMALGPAMTRDEAVRSIESGIEVANDLNVDLIGTGDMGIGNTTPSTAILVALTGARVRAVTGRGTGLDDDGLENKVETIEKALEVNQPDSGDPLDVLAKVGGFEIGGIAGCILAAAAKRKPVLIDGLISTAGALIAAGLAPLSIGYMIASHRSVEKGHTWMLDHLGLEPLLDLDLRLGEGTGAALAMHLVEASTRILNQVLTFDEASVAGADGQ